MREGRTSDTIQTAHTHDTKLAHTSCNAHTLLLSTQKNTSRLSSKNSILDNKQLKETGALTHKTYKLNTNELPVCKSSVTHTASTWPVDRSRARPCSRGLDEECQTVHRLPAMRYPLRYRGRGPTALSAVHGRSAMAVARYCSNTTPLLCRYPPQFMPPTLWGEVL